MMAMSDARDEARPVSLTFAVLSVLLSAVLGFVALFGLVRLNILVTVLSDAGLLWGPMSWVTTGRLATYLLTFLGAIAGVLWLRPWEAVLAVSREARDEDSPQPLKIAVMSVVVGFVAMIGLSAAAGAIGALLLDPRIEHPVNWLTWAHVAVFLLVGGGAMWGLVRLKPWARREPMSPATRKTHTLFGLSGLIATASCLTVIFHTMDDGNPAAFFSNSPVALWVAVFAIASWLLSWVIAWWWYFSADEHEQRASDVGLLLGGLLFGVVTPAWWVAARAGLLPQPNAMVLWTVFNVIWGIGWFWRRNR